MDFGTSGLLILAKSNEKYEEIRSNFLNIVRNKYYLAVVKGDFKFKGKFEHFLKSSGKSGSKQQVFSEKISDSVMGSLQVFKVLYQNGYSLLLVKLQTGLRHQIGAQLSYLGFPIVGDELYGGEKSERMFLHAWRYEIQESIFH